jgi:hypothetical protein|nr:MAG TPA: hypothetical protein [Caudoviricetes sp.]
MANTTNTKSTTTTKTIKQTETPVVDAEKEQLRAQLAEQQKQMSEMMVQMKVLMQAQADGKKLDEQKSEKSIRNIKFINLCSGNLNLRGTRFHRIEGQFKYKMIPESEALAVVNNMPETISSGMVYIADKKFVDDCDLDEIYRNILSDEQLKNLLTKNVDDICEIYKQCSDQQKKIITDMIANSVMDGKHVDANVLVKLGELSGKNLIDIEPLEEE